MLTVYIVGTVDTKAEELAYLAALLRPQHRVCLVDVGTRSPAFTADIPAAKVAACHPGGAGAVFDTVDRGTAVAAMGTAFARFIAARTDIAGIIGIGGGGGTSIICEGLREIAYGIPKIMVSTLASGDVAPYIGISDITMMPAVTDLAGLNRLSRVILHNATQALSGMVAHPAPAAKGKAAVGLTMFGVTTPCVTAIAGILRDSHDCMVFHATGTGGRTMEKLADSGMLTGFIDITTTEVCDLLLGGVLPATNDRFGAVARTGLPWVGSVGALDMVNFWGPETVPDRYKSRLLYQHNPNVTLMRTTTEECNRIGRWIAERLNMCEGPVRLLIPEGGVSALDAPGAAFHDPTADAALFDALDTTLIQTNRRRILRLPQHINDPAFAAAAAATFRDII